MKPLTFLQPSSQALSQHHFAVCIKYIQGMAYISKPNSVNDTPNVCVKVLGVWLVKHDTWPHQCQECRSLGPQLQLYVKQ